MSDPREPHDPLDDRLRAALGEEVDGLEADPALLARIQATRAAARRRPGGRVWLAAAVLALVGGTVAIVAQRDSGEVEVAPPVDERPYDADEAATLLLRAACADDDEHTITVWMDPDADEGDLSTVQAMTDVVPGRLSARYDSQVQVRDELRTTAPEPERVDGLDPAALPSRYVVTVAEGTARGIEGGFAAAPGVLAVTWPPCADEDATTTTTAPSGSPRPTEVAMVREDGTLVLVDLVSGDETELLAYDDPRAEGIEGGPHSIDWVDRAPEGEWIYFSTCCEPANGVSFRIARTGGEAQQVAQGAYPRVSPDGRHLATASGTMVVVTPLPGVEGAPVAYETAGFPRDLAWSPGGDEIAFAISETGLAPYQVRRVRWADGELTPVAPDKPDNPGRFPSWMPDGMPVVSSGGPIDDERSLSQDASYGWLLWVDEAGVVRAQPGHESSDRSPIPGLPAALAADW